METDYYKKYLKYKMKYIELSERMGGAKIKQQEKKIYHATVKKGKKIQMSDRINAKNAINIHRDIIKTELTRNILSGKIQWLIDFAGMIELIDWFIDEFTNNSVKRTEGNDPDYKEPKTMYFYTANGDSGHWIYIDQFGKQQQSYTNNHQKPGTNQFCQSFALIYMLNDNGENEYFTQLKSTVDGQSDKEKIQIWGDNIQVVITMWYQYIFQYADAKIQKWIIGEFKGLNDAYIKENIGKRASGRTEIIADNTDSINLELIRQKLIDINTYRYDIARLT